MSINVCLMIRHCNYFLFDFKRILKLYCSGSSILEYAFRHHVILRIGQLHIITVYSTILGCALFWCWVSLHAPFTDSLIGCYFIIMGATINGIFMAILFMLNYTFMLSVTRLFSKYVVLQIRTSLGVSANGHSLWVLDWTCYLCSPLCYFRFSTGIVYRGVPCFATDCPCGVWYQGLATCPCMLVHFLEILFDMIAGL